MKYLRRDIAGAVDHALGQMPVVVITGIRQSGKSTLVLEDGSFKEREYFTLDDFGALRTMKENPDALLEGHKALTIDEAQRVPDLFLAIKRSVDKRRTPGRFLLTGSANPSLLRGVSESLAGRAVYFNLEPMNKREVQGGAGRQPFLFEFLENLSLPRKRKVKRITDAEICLRTAGVPFPHTQLQGRGDRPQRRRSPSNR